MKYTIPEPLNMIKQGKEAGINAFIMQLYFPDRYFDFQDGLFYSSWRSLEEVIIRWFCNNHDIVVLFSAKDNLKFPNIDMERKFKSLMGTQIEHNPNDKYSRLAAQGIKLFELPKDPIESCYSISKAFEQKKLKIAVIIQRAEILLSSGSIDYRLLDSVKSWISYSNEHTLLFMTDDKTGIHNEIKHINPPILKHLEWTPPTKEDFERAFTSLKIIKPNIFGADDPKKLASACQGIYYFELENIINRIDKEKGVLTAEALHRSCENTKKEAIKATSGDWFVGEKPEITFDNIAGLEQVKELIQVKIIYPFKHPELLKNRVTKYGGGLLLYGPPGTGKTMIGKAVATELDAPFFEVKVADIKNMYVGQSENNVKKLFAEARRHPPFSIIFIDEIESLIPKRGSVESTHMNGVVAQFLAEMDGLSTHRKTPVLVIGATNRPQDIDSAALRPGRFDNKILVPLPDKKSRKQMFYLILNKRYVDEVNYEMLASETDGYSGADIADICGKVENDLSILDIKEKRSHRITTESIMKTIQRVSPSVSKMEMEWFRQYDNTPV